MLSKRLVPVLVTLALVGVALVGVACGRNDNPSIGAGQAASDHNEADVAFAQGMIPHHEQAVEMAELAPTRASDAKVKDLASRIAEAQEPEIATMKGWLQRWGEKLRGGGHDAMSGSGMMPEQEMEELEKASGRAFDRLFLAMMIRHHESAVAMAETETRDGRYGPAKDLARRITVTQQAEIEEMKTLHGAMGP